jgi:glucose dehydrogenase
LIYLPHMNLCMDWESVEVNYIAATPYVGANVRMYAGPGGHRGEVTAWDPVQRKTAWKIIEDLLVWSGALATAGDLVFYGTMEGWFKAVDARTGALLWQFKTGSGIIGQPITAIPMGGSTWPFSPAWEAGPEPSLPAASIRGTGPPPSVLSMR